MDPQQLESKGQKYSCHCQDESGWRTTKCGCLRVPGTTFRASWRVARGWSTRSWMFLARGGVEVEGSFAYPSEELTIASPRWTFSTLRACPIQVESFANDMQQSGLVMSHSCLWPWHAWLHDTFVFGWYLEKGWSPFLLGVPGFQGMNTSSMLCSWAMPVPDLASRSVRKQPFAKPMLKALRPINMCLAKMELKNFLYGNLSEVVQDEVHAQ